jgi:Mlc titration factor MtfA (ptsG expression regulator)
MSSSHVVASSRENSAQDFAVAATHAIAFMIHNTRATGRARGFCAAELERLTLLFLHEKTFEGAGGLVLTDEMQGVIAARACLCSTAWPSTTPSIPASMS